MVKISCIMIVKDEEHCLDRCLKSVRDFVDEIIVVDTGSQDRSVEIAQSFGAKVFHHPWENDFSLHRNQSIAYATGNWLMQMDADEELYPGDGTLLRELAAQNSADYFYCLMYDMDKKGNIRGVFYQIRFFRNSLNMRYVRKVHNQIETRGRGAYSQIRIRHYGYDLDPEKMEKKHLRTTSLLKKMIEENPDDPFNYYELAASYSMHKDFSEAIYYGEKALQIRREKDLRNDYFVTTFYIVAQAYFALRDFAKAKCICEEALLCFPDHLDICHVLAAIYFEEKAFDKCREISHLFLHLHDKYTSAPQEIKTFYLHSYAKRHEIYLGLGLIELWHGDKVKAEEYFRLSYEWAEAKDTWAEHLARFYLDKELVEEALPWLYRAWQKEGPPAILNKRPDLFMPLAHLCLRQDNLKMAEEIVLFFPEEQRIEKHLLTAAIAWRRGEFEDMISPLSDLIKETGTATLNLVNELDDLARILYDLAEKLCLTEKWPSAKYALQLAWEISPHLFDHGRFSHLLPHPPTH